MAELNRYDVDRVDEYDDWAERPDRRVALASLFSRIDRGAVAVAVIAAVVGAGILVGVGSDEEPEDAGSYIQAEVAAAADTPSALPRALALGGDGSVPAAGAIDGQQDDPTADTTPTSMADGATTSSLTGDTEDGEESALLATDENGEAGTSSTTGAETPTTTSTTNRSSTTATTSRSTSTTSTIRATTTTRATTSTTRATTTTTRPTTTTTRATTTTAAGNSCASGAEFELIMRDDFNGSSVGGQWFVWNNSDGNNNNGRRMASQLSVSNGRLLISANMVNGVLHSGGMNHTHAQTYGRYRFRVRTDVDPARAMSGVILTWPTSNNHLRDGENNAYETLPHQDSATRSPFYSFIHKPFAQNSSQQEYKIWQADAAQWQTITMEWTPDRISVSRDGGETWTVNETGSDLIPDVAHRLHIQLDAFKTSISGQVNMEVDFAEVYRYCG